MAAGHTSKRISPDAFSAVLDRYDGLINRLSQPTRASGSNSEDAGDTLKQLDQWRLHSLSDALHQRKSTAGGAWLEKDEVERLVKWKLSVSPSAPRNMDDRDETSLTPRSNRKHGKFRPRLTQLAASNPSETVISATKQGFAILSASDGPSAAIKKLSTLKGIGPATASLLLSVFDPVNIPFFSDECFRWIMWEDSGRGKGWDRPIKYDAKRYAELVQKVNEVRKRLERESGSTVYARDVERVAFILGKEAETQTGGQDEKRKEKRSAETMPAISPPEKKARAAKPETAQEAAKRGSAQGSRRSNRVSTA